MSVHTIGLSRLAPLLLCTVLTIALSPSKLTHLQPRSIVLNIDALEQLLARLLRNVHSVGF